MASIKIPGPLEILGYPDRHLGSPPNKLGIYEFIDKATGLIYVGSGKIRTRLLGHHNPTLNDGIARLDNIDDAVWTLIEWGGKGTRNEKYAEQIRILELGGIDNLANKVNPVAPNQWAEVAELLKHRPPEGWPEWLDYRVLLK